MRLTQSIKVDIGNNINALFNSRLDSKTFPDTFWLNIVEAAKTKIEQYSIDTPESWLTEIVEATIRDQRGGIAKYIRLPIPFSIINLNTLVSSRTLTIRWDFWPVASQNEYNSYIHKAEVINKERREFLDQATNIMSRCNTMKQLIKFWPEVNALLPQAVITQLENPTVRNRVAKKEPVLIDQDALDSLNVSLMKNLILSK